MKEYNGLEIPVGVSLTHDKGKPVVFAYVGGKGRLGMKAKRFNPRVCGGMERALKQAIRWRKQALREHNAALAELDVLPPAKPKRAAVAVRPPAKKQTARKTAVAISPVRPARKPVAAAPLLPKRKPKGKPVAVPARPVRKPVAAAPSLPRRKPKVKPAAAAPLRSQRKPVAVRRAR